MKLFTRNLKPSDLATSRQEKLVTFEAMLQPYSETKFISKRIVDTIADIPANKINPAQPIVVEDQDFTPPIKMEPSMMASAIDNWVANPDVDADLEDELKQLLLHTAINLPINDEIYTKQFAIMSLMKTAPKGTTLDDVLPSPNLIYTFSTDVRNQAMNFLADNSDTNFYDLQNGLVGYFYNKPISRKSLLVAVKNHDEFVKIVEDAQQKSNAMTGSDTKQLNDLLADLNSKQLDSIESYHFARMTEPVKLLMNAINDAEDAIVPPVNLKTLIVPETITVLNLEEMTYISADADFNSKVATANSILDQQLKRLRYTSLKKIARATPQVRNKDTSQMGAQKFADGIKKTANANIGKLPNVKDTRQMIKRISRLVKSRISKLQSENSMKMPKPTFQRASRRNPDDINLKGSVNKTIYNPDVHIYLDSSASITEEQYSKGLWAAIEIAKSLKSDIYFSSFTHVVSKATKIKVAGRTTKDIYRQIVNLPKLAGGTEYEHVWKMIDTIELINAKKRKASRLNFIITDFEYTCADDFQFNPNKASATNTFYIGMDLKNQRYLQDNLRAFKKSAVYAGFPGISSHII